MVLLSHTGLVDISSYSSPAQIRLATKSNRGKASTNGNKSTTNSKEGGASLALKVQMKDIHAALRGNVLFNKILSTLPPA